MAEPTRPFRLRDAIGALIGQQRTAPESAMTYVLIDCPPSLNLLTLNAMVASHAVSGAGAVRVLRSGRISQLKGQYRSDQGDTNPGLEIQGVVLTMHDQRTSLSRKWRRTCAVLRREGLRDHDPAQYARGRGALARQADPALRCEQRGEPGLYAAGGGDHRAERRYKAA